MLKKESSFCCCSFGLLIVLSDYGAKVMKILKEQPLQLMKQAQSYIDALPEKEKHDASVFNASYEEQQDYYIYRVALLIKSNPVEGFGKTIAEAAGNAISHYQLTH
jgi:hypothetical protein